MTTETRFARRNGLHLSKTSGQVAMKSRFSEAATSASRHDALSILRRTAHRLP